MDLYDEMIEERAGETDRLRAEVTKLKSELDKVSEDNKNLWLINRDLADKVRRSAHNMSSLIKTCRAEINRKNNTILELRREMESGLLRKAGRGSKGSGGLNRKEVQQMLDKVKDAYHRMEKLEVNGGKAFGSRTK